MQVQKKKGMAKKRHLKVARTNDKKEATKTIEQS